jgi:hypothetical protein
LFITIQYKVQGTKYKDIMDAEEAREDDGPALLQGPPLLQIQDQEEWLRRNGLMGEAHYGDESEYNQLEAREKFQEQANYQSETHSKLFEKAEKEDESHEEIRRKRLEMWKDETIDILTRNNNPSTQPDHPPMKVNLKMLASHSDTVFTMADSRQLFETLTLSLCLEDYTRDSVQAFLDMARESHLPPEESTISDDHITDACQLAHYLQCTQLLDKIVKILINEIDAANCMSLCQLADRLALPGLREASLSYIMRSLTSLETHEVWKELGSDLKEQIQGIQVILNSKNRRDLFFSSFTEYVAMFAEQVQYYKERLAEARSQQETHDPSSDGWVYTQQKIDHQAERVDTLKMMLEEHKRIFLRDDSSKFLM